MNLERAIQIAVEAHAGIIDKGGNPYVLHPLRMMMAVEREDEKIVAVLHDVVEDSDWTFDRLRGEGFSEFILTALESVTKVSDDEDYDQFINRALENPIGRAVKIADIRDNLDLTRIRHLTQKDLIRLNRYKYALSILTGLPGPKILP